MTKFLYLLLFFSFTVIFLRVVQINFSFKSAREIKQIPNRGNILDSDGNLLVYSKKKYNAYINKEKITKKERFVVVTNIFTNGNSSNLENNEDNSEKNREENNEQNLESNLESNLENQNILVTNISTNVVSWRQDIEKITKIISKTNQLQYLQNEKKKVFLLSEYLTEQQKNQLTELRLPYLLMETTYQRKYFLDNLLSYSLGFTGRENSGLNGLEYYYEDFLSFPEDVLKEKNLYLHIDLDIQYQVQKLLKKTVQQQRAKSGIVIVQNVENKSIIAIANFPDFNLTKFRKKKNIFNNQAVSMNISPGSIFKIFFLAYLLEKKKINFKEQFYCDQNYIISKKEKPIKCSAAHGYLNVHEILKYSCNSAMIEMCKKLTKKEMYQFLTKINLGNKTGIDLPYEGSGILPNYKKWKLRTKSLIPIGYGITVTPIQMINNFSTFVGNGYWQRPKIAKKLETHYKTTKKKEIKKLKPILKQKILSKSNVNILRDWLSKSVKRGSTGYLASKKLPMKIIGKTSTAQIIEDGSFSIKKYNSGFAGAFPYDDPKYSILVVINNPKESHSGGAVAAPLFNQIAKFIINNKKLSLETNQIYANDAAIFLKKKKNQQRNNFFPNLIGLSFRDALVTLKKFQKEMNNNGISFHYQIKNEKSRKRSVISQNPSHRQKINFNGKNKLVIFFD